MNGLDDVGKDWVMDGMSIEYCESIFALIMGRGGGIRDDETNSHVS